MTIFFLIWKRNLWKQSTWCVLFACKPRPEVHILWALNTSLNTRLSQPAWVQCISAQVWFESWDSNQCECECRTWVLISWVLHLRTLLTFFWNGRVLYLEEEQEMNTTWIVRLWLFLIYVCALITSDCVIQVEDLIAYILFKTSLFHFFLFKMIFVTE